MAQIDKSTQRKVSVTLKAGIVNEIVFPDTKPNHVHVNNYSGGKLYFAMSQIPSETVYDMIVYPYKADIFGQDTPVDRVRIYNSSVNDCNVEVTSYYAPFDPVILNKSNEVAITAIDAQFETTVSAFNASLPAGTQHIGGVSVDNIPHVVVDDMPEITLSGVTIDASGLTDLTLAAGTNVIGSVKVENNSSILARSGTAQETVSNMVGDIQRIVFVANDGDTNNLYVTVNGDTTNIITVKPGEIVNDIPVKCSYVTLYCDTGCTTDYRFLGV